MGNLRHCVLTLALVWSLPLAAQQPSITVVGTTRDFAGNPLVATSVTVLDAGLSARSDSTGAFHLRGLTAGEHFVRFEHGGFDPATLRVTLGSASLPDRDMGVIVLRASAVHVITLAGSVKDSLSGQGVDAVAVSVAGRLVGFSDAKGHFKAGSVALRDGALIQLRRIGYSPLAFKLWPDTAREVNLAITLTPMPFRLGEVVVEGDQSRVLYPALADFARHRKAGLGTFLTPESIARLPATNSLNVLQWAGTIVSGDRFNGYRVRIGGRCQPGVLFIDGAPYDYHSAIELLETLPPEQVLAVEIYKHAVEEPLEYNVPGAQCGVIAYWLKW